MCLDGLGKTIARLFDRVRPIEPLKWPVLVHPCHGAQNARGTVPLNVCTQVQRRALAAQKAMVRRVIGVALDRGDLPLTRLNDHTTTHTTIRTR